MSSLLSYCQIVCFSVTFSAHWLSPSSESRQKPLSPFHHRRWCGRLIGTLELETEEIIVMHVNLATKTLVGTETECVTLVLIKRRKVVEQLNVINQNKTHSAFVFPNTRISPDGVSQLGKHPVWGPPSAAGETVTTKQTHLEPLRQIKHSKSFPSNKQTRF